MSNNAEHRRAYERRHQALGLCLKCPRPAAPGKLICDRCRQRPDKATPEWQAWHREHKRVLRQHYREQGLCLFCGAERADTGVLCERHREINRANARERHHRVRRAD